ncbi:DNA repair protein RadA [Lamprobacter modestohalophilus]|uniref:DNA repair protein RadA n=1 Tax=Lamprobacter modestohalophilus TaxID=1064514 RepID=A0A9X0WAU6_9GAMM|nr:DNA repair protein RadA [Lamprobacter modestohalophilus]MBK1620091.1 DNA repair protein RadA [Lamprobacter modestohalophilus]
MNATTKKSRSVYVCNSCGAQSPKWSGRCTDCGAWNSIEQGVLPPKTQTRPGGGGYAGAAGNAARADLSAIHRLAEIAPEQEVRTPSGIAELDRVLGGGLVQGSVVLIGGDPGIGKSTLLLQASAAIDANPAFASSKGSVLYVTGEESPQQVSLRAQRLGLEPGGLNLLAETCIEQILATAAAEAPRVLVIDSIQTLFTEALTSAPGSVSQVRETAAQLVRYAKLTDTTVFLVGHVTKEGALAGPRVLEHMVDTVLYFEGESGNAHRLVRAVKNRFGAVNELGVFAMTDRGLRQVLNPSAIFLSRHSEPAPGSVVLVTREGTRPMLVEVQALVDQSPLANPRRLAVGLEQNRLAMLLAVLHRHGGIAMFDQDVFTNVVGGVRVTETAADLAVLFAVLSSFRDKALPVDLAVFGEVGLSGEIRPVPNGPDRLREAAKHGFKQAVVPKANVPKGGIDGLEIRPVLSLREAIDTL